jgi:hypothetical protein
VDREAIARKLRREQVEELLGYEREREQTLKNQIELVIAEAEGPGVDKAVFERLSAEHVEILKRELNPQHVFEPDEPGEDMEDFFGWERDEISDDDEWSFQIEEPVDTTEEELARLNEEIEDCRRRQAAYEAYLAALGA